MFKEGIGIIKLKSIFLILFFILVTTIGCSKVNPIAGGSGHSVVNVGTDSIINLPGSFNITASNSTNGVISLDWSTSSKATSYAVNYKVISSPTFSSKQAIPTLTDTITSINQGLTYKVKVVASNSYGSTESNTITVTPVNLDVAPVATDLTPTGVVEDTISIIQLAYTDTNGDLATSCTISSPTMVTISNSCSCDSGGFCTVGILGNTNYNGAASFQYSVTANGAVSNLSTANFSIAAVNDAPTMTALANQVTNEDVATGAIVFSIADVDNALTCTGAVTATSSNTTLVPNNNIVIAGAAQSCTVTISPASTLNGSTTISLSVSDGTVSTVRTFLLTVNPVNNAPTISAITSKSTNEDTVINSIAFTINDIDNTLTCSGSVSATSSNTSLIPTASVVITGTAPNCFAAITPSLNANGISNIGLVVSDGTSTATSSFSLTVNAINDAPVVSAISGQSTLENQATSAISFTISDVDNTLVCNTSVTGTSSNTATLSNSGIVIAGTAPNCTVTLTPNTNMNGVVTITLAVSDGTVAVNSLFTLSIGAVNQPPTISSISNQTTNEDTAINTIPFTINDVDNTLTCLGSVSASSSNTALLDSANIVIAGTAPNCTVTLNPIANANGTSNIALTVTDGTLTANNSFTFTANAVNDAPTFSFVNNLSTNEDTAAVVSFTIDDIDSSPAMNCTASNISIVSNSNSALITGVIGSDIIIGGTYPNCTATITPAANQFGNSNIVLRVTDNGAPGTPVSTDSNTFILTVNAINDAPVIAAVADQVTNEDVSMIAIPFTISDVDNTLTCASSVTKASSNTGVLLSSGIVIGGTAPNCTATINPVANNSGSSTITLTVSDGLLTSASTFHLTVNAVNDAPTISTVAAQTINQNTSTGAIAFTIGDIDSTLTCAGSVSKSSSNTTLLANSLISIGGTFPNCTVTANPPANMSGTSTITLTVFDGFLSTSSSFLLTVVAVNQAPTITAIANQAIDEDIPTSSLAFTIADVDSAISCSNIVGTSSNTSIIPNANIVVSGAAQDCTVVVTGGTNKNGTANITLTISDGALSANTAFTVAITAVPDLSGNLTLAANLSGVASSFAANIHGRTILFTGLTVDEAVKSNGLEVCLGTAAGVCDLTTWSVGTGYTGTTTLGGSYTLTNNPAGILNVDKFVMTPSCSTTTNYYYSIRVTNSVNRISNIKSTPAWSFWEPSCLGSALTQWLDASEGSTLSVSNGTVSDWTDKSTAGNSITQTNPGNQPSFNSTGLGTGLPSVNFDGSTSYMTANAFAYAQGQATFFAVFNGPSGSSSKYLLSEGSTGNSSYYAPLANKTSNSVSIMDFRITSNGTSTVNYATTDSIFQDASTNFIMSTDYTSGSKNLVYTYSNGVANTLSQSGATPSTNATYVSYTRPNLTFNKYCLGARFSSNTYASFATGDLGELFITNGALSLSDRQKMEGYAAHKWNVIGKLPSGHPWISTPP